MTAHIAEHSPARARKLPRPHRADSSAEAPSRHALGVVQLIERDAELAHVDNALDALAASQGGLIIVDGPLGIGRSSLLSAACARAVQRGFAVIDTRATRTEQRFEFSIVRELLQGLGEPEVAEEIDAANDVTDRAHEAVFDCLQHAIRRIAKEHPVVLAIDDVHWADASSLAALGYLARRIHHAPVLMMVTCRTSARGDRSEALDDLLDDPDARVMLLDPLSEAAVHELIRRRLDPSADRGFSASCHVAAGGVPLLVHEALDGVRAAGIAPVAEHAAAALDAASHALGSLAMTRLRRCSHAALALAEAVTVLGDEIGYRLAADVAEIDYDAAAIATEVLIEAGIFARSRALAFAQPLVRDAVLVSTNPARLDALHHAAARHLHQRGAPLELVVEHLLSAEPRSEMWVVDVLRTAAERALRARQHEQAVALLRRALAEPPTGDRAPRLHSLLGSIEVELGHPQGLARLRAVAEEADPALRCDAALGCGRLLTLAGEPAQALELLRRVRSDVESSHEAAERLDWLIATNELNCASTAKAGSEHMAQLMGNDPHDEGPQALAARALLASVRATRRSDALRHARAAVDVIHTPDSDPVAAAFAMCALTWAGHTELAETLLDQMEAHAAERGSRLVAALTLAHRSHLLLRRGCVHEARELAARALDDVHRDAWSTQAQAYPAAFLVDALVEEGELDAAGHVLSAADRGGRLLDHWSNNFVLASRGRLRLAQGDCEGARKDFEECGRRLAAWGVDNPAVIPWRSLLARTLVRIGDVDQASTLAEAELQLARTFGGSAAIGVALHAAALSKGRDGASELYEAIHELRTGEAPLALAGALTDLGTLVSGSGRKREARGPLREALDLASRCGATALRERAHAELLSSGARPRRFEATGMAALTPRERRVSQLAAEGLTNKRIAEVMFLSEKTIELHLRNTYEKLSIAGRSALSSALAPADAEAEAIAS